MSGRDDGRGEEPTDPVADAFTVGSTYERLRLRRQGFFRQPIPRKLHIQCTLLFGLAAVLPLMAAFPASVRQSLGGGSVAHTSPKVIVLGLVGGAVVFLGGLSLSAVAMARLRLGDRMTEYRAETLLSVEEVASLLGIGTGGIAILLTLGFVLLGYGGAHAVETYVRMMGRSPFAASGAGVNVVTVATSAFVGGVALFVLAQALHLELTLRIDDYGYTDTSR